jgi:CheY-like chemotaxis protein
MAKNTVLLIDDDEDDREIFELALKQASEDAICITLQSCKEALQLLSENSIRPDHIFLDINMPVMSGRECLVEIGKLDQLKDVPVYMYTTSSRMADRDSFLAMGAREMLNKPLKISDLVDMLKRLLGSSPTERDKADTLPLFAGALLLFI